MHIKCIPFVSISAMILINVSSSSVYPNVLKVPVRRSLSLSFLRPPNLRQLKWPLAAGLSKRFEAEMIGD